PPGRRRPAAAGPAPRLAVVPLLGLAHHDPPADGPGDDLTQFQYPEKRPVQLAVPADADRTLRLPQRFFTRGASQWTRLHDLPRLHGLVADPRRQRRPEPAAE